MSLHPSIVIAGGGFSGASAAIQLVRASSAALDVTIIEPRAQLGSGIAYASTDPDHRLNGSAGTHFVDPADPGELTRWCEATRLLERDPEALAPNGQLYIRRAEFARFVAETVEAHRSIPNGSTIRHLRARVVDAIETSDRVEVVTDAGQRIEANMLVLATGNGAMRLPWPLDQAWSSDSRLIADPFGNMARVRAIAPQARVLVVGAGLTALDILSTLVRQQHVGPITVLSRHGLRPRPQRPPNPDSSAKRLLQRIDGPMPAFIAEAPRTALAFTRALRAAVREAERAGGDWYGPFDDMRDTVWKAWPLLDAREKKRFLQWLRPMYDMHRFRTPPQNDAMVREAEARGTIVFTRGQLQSVLRDEDAFDVVINCTGLDASCGAHDNPLLVSLLAQGSIRRDATGIGFEVDAAGRPIGGDGVARDRMRIVGPPTAGACGDPLGVLFIAPQVARVVRSMLAPPLHSARR
jgi:uncharacterized NAD(P)/FAD-binding protein YdhS